jgi:hypothetical protein
MIPSVFLVLFPSYLASKTYLISIFTIKIEFFSRSHIDTACAKQIKVRASFTVILPTLPNFKSVIVLHKNIQLHISFMDQSLKSNENLFAL